MRETTFGNLLVVFAAQPRRRKRVPSRWALCLSLSPIQWVRAMIAAMHSSVPCCFPNDFCTEKKNIRALYNYYSIWNPQYLHSQTLKKNIAIPYIFILNVIQIRIYTHTRFCWVKLISRYPVCKLQNQYLK